MRLEDELQYMLIRNAELTDKVSALIDQNAELQRQRDGAENRARKELEEFYKGLMEDQKAFFQHQFDEQAKSHEKQIESLKKVISELTAKLSATDRRSRAKLYGKQSEKASSLPKRKGDDDRDEEKDDFDGTGCPPTGSSGSTGDSKTRRQTPDDAVKAVQNRIKRNDPSATVKVKRISYEKAMAYTDSPSYVRLEDYYTLPEGGRYVMRNGEIDKSYMKVIVYHPGYCEELIYETATVRFRNEEDTVRTIDTIECDRPVPGCLFSTETLCYILMEKFYYHTPFNQIVRKLRDAGVRMSKTTLGDNVHKAIEYMRNKLSEYWEKALFKTNYWMMDETPGLVGVEDEKGNRSYRKRYIWTLTALKLKLTWMFYEGGSRGVAAVKKYLENFLGFYTTDGYVVYKVFSAADNAEDELAGSKPRRCGCLVHIRRRYIDALEENYDAAMWFIDLMAKIFQKEHHFKVMNLSPAERYVERRKAGSVEFLMHTLEERLRTYEDTDYVGCGELMKKALKYMRAEWPAMQRVLVDGSVEVSNNLSEQSVRRLKTNLKNAGNIGSEASAQDNAFMFSVIQSCQLNERDPKDYIRYLLQKLRKSKEGEDLTPLLPCYCSV